MSSTLQGVYDQSMFMWNDNDNIEMYANANTLKSEMILKNNYEVDFREHNSISSLLGFKNKTLHIRIQRVWKYG